MKKNKHIGSDFDDFLEEEGILDEVEEAVAERICVFQLENDVKLSTNSNTAEGKFIH